MKRKMEIIKISKGKWVLMIDGIGLEGYYKTKKAAIKDCETIYKNVKG